MSNDDRRPVDPVPVLAISPGIAIGPAYIYAATRPEVALTTIEATEVESELQRLQAAITVAGNELQTLSERVARTAGPDKAEIFAAQQMMLEDPDVLEQVQALISEQHYTASAALQQVAEQQAQELEALENDVLAARSSDIRDAFTRAIRYLTGAAYAQLAPDRPVIVLAHSLTPSDTANLDPRNVLGLATVTGGPNTHAAIIARTLEIPSITNMDPTVLKTLREGEIVALDGSQGLLYLHPDDEQQRTLHATMLRQQQQRIQSRLQDEAIWRNQAATTADGQPVEVFANVGDIGGARAAAEDGAQGIGLLRTEFLFGSRSVFPDEQEQFTNYIALFRAFASHSRLGKTIIARTLDAGADKPFPALEPLLGSLHEENPALGLRGARIHLVHQELLRQQLRALLRAGTEAGVQLHIMFPMIATLEEVRRLRAIYTAVCQELVAEGISLLPGGQLGIMVETPAAALMADVLAREVDFFSIGANDLYQYTLAADRTNSRVAALFGALEPALWRSIAHIVQAARAQGKLVAVCGEMAADVRIGPALVGLGVQELSMNPPAIIRVKAALHRQPMKYWQRLAQQLLQAETADEVQRVLQAEW